MTHRHTRNAWLIALVSAGVCCGALAGMTTMAGCSGLGQLVGGMAASAERTGKSVHKAKYIGLEGKTFAVVVSSDRSIQADFPEIVPLMTREMTQRLAEHCGASGVLAADEVLRFQYQRPSWVAMTPADLAKALGVNRLVFVELTDYSLTDPGNAFIWRGNAAAAVRVLETDGQLPTDFAYREALRVKFPDSEGLGPAQIPMETVQLELSRRIINRAAWLFYDHEEPNAIKY